MSKDLVERLSYRALHSIPFLSFVVDWLFGIYKPFNQNAQLQFWMCINSTHVRRVSCLNMLIKESLHFQLLFCFGFLAIKATGHQFLTDHKYSKLDRQSRNIYRKTLTSARIVKWIGDYLDKLHYELKLALVHSCKCQWTRQANSLPVK